MDDDGIDNLEWIFFAWIQVANLHNYISTTLKSDEKNQSVIFFLETTGHKLGLRESSIIVQVDL